MMVDFGRVGLWSAALSAMPAEDARASVRHMEALGFPTVWINESFTREALVNSSLLLSWTDSITVATGIANIWARDAVTMANGARTLAEAFPGRFVLGLGVSHAPLVAPRGHVYEKPLAYMRRYLAAMDDAPFQGAQPAEEVPRVLAALGPRMLEMSGELTDGALTYFVPPEHTVQARSAVGPDATLAVEQAVVLRTDLEEARQHARTHMGPYLGRQNYQNNLKRLGWDEHHFQDGISDQLVDEIVAIGVDDAVDRVQQHLDAGADHVCVQVLGSSIEHLPLDDLDGLADRLL